MFITLHCGGMPFDGESFKTQSLGGSETAAYYLARDLADLGHKVTIFTNSQNEGTFEGVKYQFAGQQTEQTPLGDRFTFYAENTPTDILIIQRHPDAWRHDWAAKVRLWWVHDLALQRSRQRVHQGLWNCDGILCVSEYHREQVADVYGIDPEFIHVLRNGVDLGLYRQEAERAARKPDEPLRMIYSSRPERGLAHLVEINGIMSRLDNGFQLDVCMYENVPQHMEAYYRHLWQRIEALPNVRNLGCLTKAELAEAMERADLHVYPTEFEEVSCITAMEAAAAGLPMVTSEHAALPETTKGGGVVLIPLKDGEADEDAFVKALRELKDAPVTCDYMRQEQLEKSEDYSWEGRGRDIERIFYSIASSVKNDANMMRHFMRNSDIFVLKHYIRDHKTTSNRLTDAVEFELKQCYGFAEHEDADLSEHYDEYYKNEEEKGAEFGPQNMDGETRYEHIKSLLSSLPKGARVLDYGCAHGHFTINLSSVYPDLEFVGIDICQKNIDIAESWGNVRTQFICGQFEEGLLMRSNGKPYNDTTGFDVIICAEVLEHVIDPQGLVDGLCTYLKKEGMFIATTPYGAWESDVFKKDWPIRAHLHHFEREDLSDMFGMHPDYKVVVAPFTGGADGRGSYIATFAKPESFSGYIDYDRKIANTVPRQTLSVCMIAKDAEGSILRTLETVSDIADEVRIFVDKNNKDTTEMQSFHWSANNYPYPVSTVEKGCAASESGFDEARNLSIEGAYGDWIMWIDTDEVLSYPERLPKYLRHNQFKGYAIKQHHFSAEPLGVMKTDIPVRLFRNHEGVHFIGRVHEHPEVGLNKGVGRVMMVPDADILHNGYTNEKVRRARFWRNIGLMVRDREDYPNRTLGKFLWLRDLCQMCQYEMEHNGGRVSPAMVQRANDGIEIFMELAEANEVRYVLEGLNFYSPLVRILGKGFNASFSIAATQNGDIDPGKLPDYQGRFLNKDHFNKVVSMVQEEAMKDLDKPYQ